MIDLHSHLLPGLDDGARTIADSLAIARDASAAGVTMMAATPHLRADHPGVDPAQLGKRCADLESALRREGITLAVIPGGELDINWAQRASDEVLRLVSYGQAGTWLLVETPYATVSELFEDMLFVLNARGFQIVLAHPERNPSFQRRPERLRGLVERGAVLQLTARALVTAERRTPERRLAETLVRDSMAHVMATDVHRASGRRSGLAEAAAAADALVPGAGAYLTREAPAAIVAGERPAAPPQRRRGPWLARRLGGLRP